MTNYLVEVMVEGKIEAARFEGEISEFVEWMTARGHQLDDPAYETRTHLLPALQGQPCFKNMWGPGSNGNPVRYQDWPTFRAYEN